MPRLAQDQKRWGRPINPGYLAITTFHPDDVEPGESACLSYTDMCPKAIQRETDLFDGNSGLPSFLLIENREANRARGIDVRVEKGGSEFAYVPALTIRLQRS
jgi:hypothetical protein